MERQGPEDLQPGQVQVLGSMGTWRVVGMALLVENDRMTHRHGHLGTGDIPANMPTQSDPRYNTAKTPKHNLLLTNANVPHFLAQLTPSKPLQAIYQLSILRCDLLACIAWYLRVDVREGPG